MNIQKAKLVPALERACKIARGNMPETRCVKLVAEGGILTISASDGIQFQSETLECVGDLPPVIVPAGGITSIATYGLNDQTYTVEKPGWLHCDVGAHVNTPCLVADYPEPALTGMKKVGINTGDLATGISSVAWAMSTERGRPELNAVSIEADENNILCAAAVGIYFAFHHRKAIAAKAMFCIPREFVSSFVEALQIEGSELSLSDNLAYVWSESRSYTCRLLDLKYPNVRNITDPKRDDIGVINRDEWLDIFRMIQSLCPNNETAPAVLVSLTPTEARFEYSGKESADYDRSIAGSYTELSLNLNAITFTKLLASFPSGSELNLRFIPDFKAVELSIGDLSAVTTQLR